MTGPEMTALALLLAGRALEDYGAPLWELVPELTEDEHRWLSDEIRAVGSFIHVRLAGHEALFGVDARQIHAQVQG